MSNGAMDYMVRLHSSANYSFDLQKANLSDDEDDLIDDEQK